MRKIQIVFYFSLKAHVAELGWPPSKDHDEILDDFRRLISDAHDNAASISPLGDDPDHMLSRIHQLQFDKCVYFCISKSNRL